MMRSDCSFSRATTTNPQPSHLSKALGEIYQATILCLPYRSIQGRLAMGQVNSASTENTYDSNPFRCPSCDQDFKTLGLLQEV